MSGNTVINTTKYGPIIGCKRMSLMGDEFYSFRGIRYAKAPIGDLRFKAPQPPEPWSEPMDATQHGNSSLFVEKSGSSAGKITSRSSEDCLFINVYTKELTPLHKLPVMVWIHGGAYKTGSGNEFNFGPDYLLQKDIVLCTFNYRLGALGFLSVDDPTVDAPGNAGLKDQTLALHWVKENIGFFGGDSKNVTIFGGGAGGVSVCFHLLSELSKGLFHKAISQSGTNLPFNDLFRKKNWSERLAVKLGWDGKGGDLAMYKFLKEADANDIVMLQDSIRTSEEIADGLITFSPSYEPYKSAQCFLAPEMDELSVWSTNVPLIIGGNADEGLVFYRAAIANRAFHQSFPGFERAVPLSLGYERGSEKSKQLASDIRDFYYRSEIPTEENFMKSLQIWGDKFFWYGIHLSVISRKSAIAPTYLYRFDVDSRIFDYKKLSIVGEYIKGCCHADDILYLFKHINVKNLPSDSRELVTVNRMVEMWTQFAITGNPNSSNITPTWEPISNHTPPFKCLNISDELSFIELPDSDRMEFWDSIYSQNQTKYIFITSAILF